MKFRNEPITDPQTQVKPGMLLNFGGTIHLLLKKISQNERFITWLSLTKAGGIRETCISVEKTYFKRIVKEEEE